MNLSVTQSIAIIAVTAVCTFLTRVIPFLVFGGKKEVPKEVKYLGNVLPPAIMAILVVYCLREVQLFTGNHGLPQLIAVAIVVVLHLWKKNILLSIGVGTVSYMALVQMVFK